MALSTRPASTASGSGAAASPSGSGVAGTCAELHRYMYHNSRIPTDLLGGTRLIFEDTEVTQLARGGAGV